MARIFGWFSDWCNRNHCTCFVDGLGKWRWGDCCAAHDIAYMAQEITRAEADRLLYECVKKSSHPVMAWIMWACVRIFGGMGWRRYGG